MSAGRCRRRASTWAWCRSDFVRPKTRDRSARSAPRPSGDREFRIANRARRTPLPSGCSRPVHPARKDNRQARPSLRRTAGIPRHKPPALSPQPPRACCAGGLRLRIAGCCSRTAATTSLINSGVAQPIVSASEIRAIPRLQVCRGFEHFAPRSTGRRRDCRKPSRCRPPVPSPLCPTGSCRTARFSLGDWFWFRRRNVSEIEKGKPRVVTAPVAMRAFRSFFVHHDPDDLDLVRRLQLREHRFAVGHLRHRFRRDETHRVEVPKAGGDQARADIPPSAPSGFARQPLPGIARAFDQLHRLLFFGRG